MKRKLLMLTTVLTTSLALVACGSTSESQGLVKIGMMTDSGTIDDRSFNQATWEGIERYKKEQKTIATQYIQPLDQTTADYIQAADDLILAGNQMIVASGFKFEEAITHLQEQYPEIKFVMIDGAPTTVAENTVGICFAEHEAGFLAGVVAALQTETGKLGFVGGLKSNSVERFGYGYVAGVAYANKHLGTAAEVTDYVYNGTFTDVAGGQAQAGSMYDKGIDIIFTAAGRVGNGVITEAKTRAEASEKVFVIGVDVDQYELGKMPNGESVILTSAIKRVDNASYDKVEEFMEGSFQGGEVIMMNAKNDGIGLPETNPNLTEETQALAKDILA